MHSVRRAGSSTLRQRRPLSSRAAKVLNALDIPTDGSPTIPGVYDGQWGGSGEPQESRCPATGELLANVSTVRCLRA